jgi:hypothetical protein
LHSKSDDDDDDDDFCFGLLDFEIWNPIEEKLEKLSHHGLLGILGF